MKSQWIVKLTYCKTTHKATFASQPTWEQLAGRIESSYHIPARASAIKYTDADGDELTINTDEELQEYYETLATDRTRDPKNVKLEVHRLASPSDDVQNPRRSPPTVEEPESETSGMFHMYTTSYPADASPRP